MQSDTVGWLGNVGAALCLVKNTQHITEIDLHSHVQYKTQKDIWLAIAHYGFLKGGKDKFVSNSFGHLRYNRKFNSWLRWEIFTQAQNNFATNIDARYLVGTGPRFKLADNRFFHLYIASLFMYEYERERSIPPIIHRNIRNSSYISFTIRPDNIIEIISTTFYQPLPGKMTDFRILNETLLKAKTGKHFSLAIEWNYLFDAFPAGESPKTTYDFKTGLQYDF